MAFYENALGLAVKRRLPPLAVELAHGGCSLILHSATRPRPNTDLDDCRVTLSFSTPDVRESLTRLRDSGVERLTSEPRPSPFGEWLAFRDPFGNVMELVALRESRS